MKDKTHEGKTKNVLHKGYEGQNSCGQKEITSFINYEGQNLRMS